MTEAAVIIPHYNDTARLLRCLAALMPQIDAAAGAVDVVVVDNGSTDPLDAVRATHPGLRIVTETRKGAAAARNRGVAETAAPRLFFLDADCVPAGDWLARARAVAPRADLVGGTVTLFDETPGPRNGPQAFETVFAFNNRRYIETKGFSVTANLLTRRDVFAATGDFVPGLSEDLDWCHRARARGYILRHDDTLRVAHPTRGDWPALVGKWRRINDESFALGNGGARARALWGLRGLAMLPSIAVHGARIATTGLLSGPGERTRALATLTRQRLLRCGWMLRQAIGGRKTM